MDAADLQLPCSQACSLVSRSRFVDVNVNGNPTVVRGIYRSCGGADIYEGEPAWEKKNEHLTCTSAKVGRTRETCVAVGENVENTASLPCLNVADKFQSMITDPFAKFNIFVRNDRSCPLCC